MLPLTAFEVLPAATEDVTNVSILVCREKTINASESGWAGMFTLATVDADVADCAFAYSTLEKDMMAVPAIKIAIMRADRPAAALPALLISETPSSDCMETGHTCSLLLLKTVISGKVISRPLNFSENLVWYNSNKEIGRTIDTEIQALGNRIERRVGTAGVKNRCHPQIAGIAA